MTKMARKILVIFSSILLTFCVALGLFVIPKTKNVQAATQYTVKEATLNKINATSGIANNVQYIAFDGYSSNTWFMTEFTGKNAPNYAVRAIDGYSTWDADTASETVLVGSDTTTKAGILLTNSSENQNTNISVYRGTNTNATRKGHAGGTSYCGMYRYADSTQYIQIVGYEIIEGSSTNAAMIYQYLFKVGADGSLTAVTPTTGTVNYVTHVLTGSKAVIYGNIQDNRSSATEALNPSSVTFKYAQPGTSLSELVNNIDDSYAYKTALMTSLNIESTYATVTLKDNSGDVIATKAVTKGEAYTLPASEIENFSAWLVGETEYQPGDNVTITEDTVITAKVVTSVVDYTVKEATLNKINASSGIASNVQYIAFDGYSSNTWFMTEFTGKNAPNYAVRAIDGYSTWDANTAAETVTVDGVSTTKAGILLTNSSENQNTNISVYRGTNTNATRKGHAGGTNYCGMYRYADSTQYIQIVGYEIIEGSSTNAATIHQYLFKVGADGSLTAVTPTTGTVNYVTHVLTGSKAVIYGNIQDNRSSATEALNPSSVTFKYAQPGTSLSELVNNIDNAYAYKAGLMEALGIESPYATVTLKDNNGEIIVTETVAKGEHYTLPSSDIENFTSWLVGETEYQPGDNVTITEDTVITAKVVTPVVDYTVKEATLNKINASSGIANDVQYIAFDGYSGNTWFLTEFVGKNSPNYAVRAVDGYSTWDADTAAQTVKVDGVSTTIAGMLITNSTETQNTNIRIYRSTNTTSSQRGTANANKGGIYRYTDNVRYIQIVGYEAVEESTDDSATLYSYIFTVDANGTVTLLEASSGNATYATNALTGNKAVIYGNIQDTRTTATEALNPSSVTFKYAQPGVSLSELLNNIDNSYTYKNSLMDLLNIDDINSVTVSTKTEDGETISSEKVDNNANYTFPENDMSGFAGWLYNGGLYPAGYVLTLTDEDIVLTAVTMELKLDVGAGIRISNNNTQYGGLRFEVMINTADLTALSSYITSTKGMIIPTDLIVGDFDIAESEAKTVDLDNMLDEEDGYSHAFITLTNILYANYNREFSAKAYVTLTYSNGATAVIETKYTKEDNSRSIYEVAVLAYEDYKSSSVLLSYLNSTLNFKVSRDEDGDYVFSTNHTVDGLPADYTRGYSIVSQAVTQNANDENLSDITLTVSMDVADRLYATNSLPKIPVTIWFEDYRLNIEPTVVSYNKTNKEAVLMVTLATDPSYELGEGEYTIWAYSATCDDWYQYKDENGDTIKITFEDGTRQTFEHTQWYAEGGFNVLFADWTFPFKGATESFADSKLKTVMDYAYANGLKVFIYENNLHRLSQFSSTWIDGTNGVKETDSMAFNASGTTTFASEEALKAYVAYSLREVKDHPAFYGVSLLDEASYAQFPYIGKIYRAVQEVAPGAFVNMNINPMSNNQTPMRKYSATWAETTLTTFTTEQVESAYQDYLNTYYTEIGQYCGYIQYDNYPILENGILSNHLRTAQVVAEFAEEKNMKFGMVNQTYTSSGRRAPTENDMYWQLNLSMAMGVDLYSYYYYYPVPNASALPDDTATIVDREGNRNERYYWLQAIHEDMQVVAKAMDNFKYQGLKYYTKGTSIGSVDFLTDVDNNGALQKVSNVTLGSDGVILATELYDDYMNQYGYYVMNATDPLQNASQSITLTFEGYSHVQVYQDGTIVNYALNNGSITLSLACGRGAFVLPY